MSFLLTSTNLLKYNKKIFSKLFKFKSNLRDEKLKDIEV